MFMFRRMLLILKLVINRTIIDYSIMYSIIIHVPLKFCHFGIELMKGIELCNVAGYTQSLNI